MSYLTQHPLSAAFPSMSAEERTALQEDIEKNGLRQPVVVWQGQILDGWHRYQACLDSGREPALVEFEGADPVVFVLSQNMHRRHLSASQRAAAVVSCSAWKALGSNQHTEGRNPVPTLTESEMAKQANTSDRTIRHAKKANAAGLSQPVIDGDVSAKTAAAVAGLPTAKRKKVTAKPPEDWQAELERKTPPPEPTPEPTPEQAAELDDAHERMSDLAADLESALKIIEADDKLAAALEEVRLWRHKHDQLERLYNAQRGELATMTKEAKRHARRADALEKSRKGAA